MRLFMLFLTGVVTLFPFSTSAQQRLTPSTTLTWQNLAAGLAFSRWSVQSESRVLDVITILRFNPDQWAFKVFYNSTPKTLQEWQQITKAPIVCNGGFFQENYRPVGRILVNGASIGPTKNNSMKGMFLAEPKSGLDKIPKARLIDLKEEKSEETISQYDQGIQSFPVLLDSKGQVRVNPSNFQANRTVIAQDIQGHILILITERPFFTLYDLGNYLKALPLGIAFALNLDGGYRTQLAIQVKGFRYVHAGQGETQETARLFFPEGTVKLPSVIGIFFRGGSL